MIDQPWLQEILDDITLPEGWRVNVQPVTTPLSKGWNVQILFMAKDHEEPYELKEQHCRKWYISQHSTLSEVVRTVYKAGVAAWEHEFDETFKYRSTAIYSPHLDVDHLADQIQNGPILDDRRPEPDGNS